MTGREEWRVIASYPDYAVSSLGNIKRVLPDHYGRGVGRVMTPVVGNHGYLVVTLHNHGKQRTLLIHRIVCEAFNGPAPDEFHAAHSDGNKRNNTAANLRWATAVDNNADKHFHGTIRCGDDHHARLKPETMPRGEGHGNSKLTASAVLAIRTDGRPHAQIAAEHGVSKSLISMVKNRAIWAHV